MYHLRAIRTFAMPIVELFQYWTCAEYLGQWLAPEHSCRIQTHITAHRGTRWHLRYELAQQCYEIQGELRELTAPVALLTSWYWHGSPQTTLLDVRLHALGANHTELDLRHSTFADATSRNQHRHFWQQALQRLAAAP